MKMVGDDRRARALSLAGVAALVMVCVAGPSAQWPAFQTPGVPRTPAGEPILDAPTPRTIDGKPDLSGNWVRWAPPGGGGRRGAPPPAPPPGTPPVATFGDVGAGFPGGLPFQPWAAELKQARMAINSRENPDALCLPMGHMQFHTHGQPRKMIQTPNLVVIIYEANYGLRYIYTDGRPLPPQGEPQPWWYGYSVGRWEGDTLVVETNNLLDNGWLDVRGSPLTDQARITERFRRISFGRLEIDVTIDDPKAYTRPFTVRVNQQIRLDDELIEFICNENQQFGIRIKLE
jgi:hypothetical protein